MFLATKPTAASNGTTQFERKTKEKEPNRGFKTAIDGRLIIAEPKRGGEESSDSEDDEVAGIGGGAQKRAHSDSSDDDNEDAAATEAVSRKRKAIDSQSMASGRSSSKYQTGGKGIHRQTGASSVRSGASRMSMATTKSASTAFGGGGEAFRGKKGKGDIKKKGKLDPYAYIPLSRTSMNKR